MSARAQSQPLPHLIRTLRRALGGADRFSATPFADLTRAHTIATNAVRYFYFASALYVWMLIPRLHLMASNNPPLDLAWPLLWAEGLPILAVVDTISVGCASLAVLACWRPDMLAWRAGFAATYLMCAAVPLSLGAVNHGMHEWFWVAFVFAFLPAGHGARPSRAAQLTYVMTFAAAQGIIFMFYTMAGYWKALAGVKALIAGEPGNFSPLSLSWTIADRILQTNGQPLLGPFLIENPWITWPGFLFIIYAQVVALVVFFRPSLHRFWALALIGFHTGTFVFMEIKFPAHIALLVVLFLVSPFQREDWAKWATLYHLPIFGDMARWMRERRNTSRSPQASPQPVPKPLSETA